MIFATAPVFGQIVNPAKLKIHGSVGLDSAYAQVVRLLGIPADQKVYKMGPLS